LIRRSPLFKTYSQPGLEIIDKKKRKLESSIQLFQFYGNFINEFKKGITPAMLKGLTDHILGWNNFLMYHYVV